MTRVRLQLGRRSDDRTRIGFKVVSDAEEDTVRESRVAFNTLELFRELTKEGLDENLKPQFEIILFYERKKDRTISQRIDYRWVPDSGCDRFIVNAGLEIYNALKQTLKKTLNEKRNKKV